MKCPNCQVYNLAGAKFDINWRQSLQTEITGTNYGEPVAVGPAVPAKHSGQSARMLTPPAGKEITMRANIFARTKNDNSIEAWQDADYPSIMQQPDTPAPSQHISDGAYL